MKTTYKPILFSTEMVKAILDGRKTQTRRIIKNQMLCDTLNYALENLKEIQGNSNFLNQAKYQIGNILWVRESFQYSDEFDEPIWYKQKAIEDYTQEAFEMMKWKPSIHMPKEAARIFLEVTNVRVERLADISEEDAIAEGIEFFNHGYGGSPVGIWYKNYLSGGFHFQPNSSFKSLWQKINGIDSWYSNPWVWVYEFKQVEKPKDFING